MIRDSILEIVAMIAATVAGWALRWFANQRQWRQARQIARAELHSTLPGTTDDPDVAMEKATVTVQKHRIRREARLLAPSTGIPPLTRPGSQSDMNGSGHKGEKP